MFELAVSNLYISFYSTHFHCTSFYSAHFDSTFILSIFILLFYSANDILLSFPFFIPHFYSTVTFLHFTLEGSTTCGLRIPTTFYSTTFYSAKFYSAVTFLHLHLRVTSTWGSPPLFLPSFILPICIPLFLLCCDLFALTLEGPHQMRP